MKPLLVPLLAVAAIIAVSICGEANAFPGPRGEAAAPSDRDWWEGGGGAAPAAPSKPVELTANGHEWNSALPGYGRTMNVAPDVEGESKIL